MGRGRDRLAHAMVRILGLFTAFGAWEAGVRLLRVPASLLPAPSAILPYAFEIRAALAAAAGYTMSEALGGYLAGLVVGGILGVLFAHSRTLERSVFPFFVASQAVPAIAFSAIVILWLGNGPASKVAIAFYLTFFPIIVSVVKGLHACDRMAVALLRTFGASAWQILWKLRMPAALPFVFVALRVGTTTAIVGAIVGEWFGDNRGIGILILHALYTEDMVRLWSGILTCAVMGALAYGAVGLCERRCLWWPSPELES